MKQHSKLTLLAFSALLCGAGAVTSCNKDGDSYRYTDPVNLAVTEFKLKANPDISGLDSAYFSIDLQRGIIFNADSLRKGTKIDKVVADITFKGNVSEAIIEMEGGTTREGEINYRENPTDSIDFTGNVILRVKADNNTIATSYRIKVNVHNEPTDSMRWDNTAKAALPSRLGAPLRQKTVSFDDRTVCLIEENDGTYTLSSTTDVAAYQWSKHQVNMPFIPDVRSLASTSDALYILSENGKLYTCDADMTSFTDTGEIWSEIIGNYVNTVVGLRSSAGVTHFTQYPLTDLNIKEIPEDFPVSGISNFVTLANKWTSSPVAFFTGGRTTGGKISDDTWAFDGSEWIRLSSGGIPALEGASLIPYYNYRPSSDKTSMIEYNVWMLLGGLDYEGKANRTVYISYDNGVNWTKGSSNLQLPEEIPAMVNCDNIVAPLSMSANLSDAWEVFSKPKRIRYTLDGDVITWECPYIYLFGGTGSDGRLYDTVWQGVLTRLTFTPII